MSITPNDLTKKYFDASNARDFSNIEELLQDDATYSSDTTGIYFGKGDILDMMRRFYSKFPSLHWKIESIEEAKPQIVEVHFVLVMRVREGVETHKKGIERLVITEDTIRHNKVRTL